jgi:hypothetical protein
MRGADGAVVGDLTSAEPTIVTLTPEPLWMWTRRLLLPASCPPASLVSWRTQGAWAEMYLRGLLTADIPRKNVDLEVAGAFEGRHARWCSCLIVGRWTAHGGEESIAHERAGMVRRATGSAPDPPRPTWGAERRSCATSSSRRLWPGHACAHW